MKIVISADMEGTTGVVEGIHVRPPDQANPAGSSAAEYGWARLTMTREVNAAIEGALEAGAEQVIVNESHDGMRNLLPEELHREALLISGVHKPLSMAQGVDEPGVAGLIYTGYHAKAGTPNGVLAHTYVGFIRDVRLNGVSVGEYGINAAVAGHFGVPVIMVTGDDHTVRQTQELLGERVVGVIVKRGIGTNSAIHLHPAKARDLIREGAAEAVRRIPELKPYNPGWPCRVEVDVDHQVQADLATIVPGVARNGERGFVFTAEDGVQLVTIWRAVLNAMMTRFAV
ncbi:M55 family metallopeptidase [Sphaerobacter thermophilus]|uniref:M55 family metallopeptidase n=1 Tax=Sphaerobacter thermophilus TaxID=2057 RepID=UPI0039C02D9E